MNRRDFALRSASKLAEDICAPLVEAERLEADNSSYSMLLRFGRRLMASQFEVVLPFGTSEASAVARAAFDLLDGLEQRLTVYRPSSPISRLNRIASFAAVPLEDDLFELFSLAERINRDTEGAFDISAGCLIKAWGFYRGPKRVPAPASLQAALEKSGMRNVELDPDSKTARFRRTGLEINLGSIGKGYALDRAAQYLKTERRVTSALLHGGYSSLYAIGDELGGGPGWKVGIAHPWKPGCRLAMVNLRDRGMATSAATFQHLEYQGRKLGHILDPRTGWPAQGMASVSVVAPTAAEADALTTAFFILGVEKAKAYCEAHPGIGAVLLPEGADASPVVVGLKPEVRGRKVGEDTTGLTLNSDL
jgi:FAD:protein FMN transferase